MPKKPSPKSLKDCALKEVSLNIEYLCYGLHKGSKELAKSIHDEDFLDIEGPFIDWPPTLLEEIVNSVYHNRSGQTITELLYLKVPHT